MLPWFFDIFVVLSWCFLDIFVVLPWYFLGSLIFSWYFLGASLHFRSASLMLP
jgi:hypothetical protein